jgi:hypothetical protein
MLLLVSLLSGASSLATISLTLNGGQTWSFPSDCLQQPKCQARLSRMVEEHVLPALLDELNDPVSDEDVAATMTKSGATDEQLAATSNALKLMFRAALAVGDEIDRPAAFEAYGLASLRCFVRGFRWSVVRARA